MIQFMDRFSEFFIKWLVNPLLFLGALWFVLDVTLCQSYRWIHLSIFLAGFDFYWCMQFLPKKRPDLEHLEDESDEK